MALATWKQTNANSWKEERSLKIMLHFVQTTDDRKQILARMHLRVTHPFRKAISAFSRNVEALPTGKVYTFGCEDVVLHGESNLAGLGWSPWHGPLVIDVKSIDFDSESTMDFTED